MRRLAVWAVWSCAAALSVAACGEDSRRADVPASTSARERGRPELHDGGAPGSAGEAPLAGGGGSVTDGEPPGGAGAGGAPSVVSKTVSGTVHAGWAAFPGVVVRLNDREVTSGADGSFTFEDAPDEYQLLLYVADYRFVRVYDGLRTRHPVIDLGPEEPTSATKEATIQGKSFGGASTPLPHDYWTDALYLSRTRGHLQSASFEPPGPFELNLRWAGDGDTDQGELLVLQTIRSEGATVSAYTGYGKRAVEVSDGMRLGSLSGSPLTDVTLTDPDEYTVGGELSVPEELTLSGDMLRISGWRTPTFLSVGSYALTLPDVPEPKALQLELFGDAGSVRRSWSLPDAATSDYELIVPPLPEPLGDTTLGRETELSWRGLPEESVALIWMKVGDFTLERVTSAANARLVDLSVVGEALPPGAEGTWSVQAVGPASSVDEALIVLRDAALQSPTSWFLVEGASRGFAYQPDGARKCRNFGSSKATRPPGEL